MTTWKISKNLLTYFKEQNDIIHNFENIKNISSIIFEEKYNNLAKSKINRSLNENSRQNQMKEKKYKLMFKSSIDYKKNYTADKINNKRKVSFLNNYTKAFPKDYLRNKIQKYKLKDSHTINKNKKSSYVSLLFNNLGTKSHAITYKRNEDIKEFITPSKKTEIQDNNILFETNNESKHQNSNDKKSISSSLSNLNGVNNNSNSTKSTIGKRPPSGTNKISTFGSTPSTTQYRSRNRMKSTLLQNFMSCNKNMTTNKTTKKKKRIYFRNGNNNICSIFNFSKISDNRNPLYIFSCMKLNKVKYSLTVGKGKSVDKRPNEQFVSEYNFPFIYETHEDEDVF